MPNFKRMTEKGWLAGLVALLFFLFMVNPCTGDGSHETVVVFQVTKTEVRYKGDSSPSTHKPSSFSIPAFVSGMVNKKEFLAIICGATFRDSSETTFSEGVARTSYDNHKQWTAAEVFTNNAERDNTRIFMGEFTAVMKEEKIYVLAISFDAQKTSSNEWNPLMFVGTVTAPTGSSVGTASIKWDAGKSLKSIIKKAGSDAESPQFFFREGKAIVTKNGEIVFPIRLQDATNSEPTSSILYSPDNGETWNIGENTEVGTTEGNVVEWGDGKLLFIVSSSAGYRKAFESDNMGTTWKESLMFSQVWGNAKNRKSDGGQGSAIKVPVDQKDVLLFAHPLSESGGSSIDTLQLWLSDGQRIVRIGTISDNEIETQTGSSILSYVGDNLYIMHEINPITYVAPSGHQLKDWEGVIGMSPLTDFLESVKRTVRAWRALDTKYMSKGVPTNALVGFLEIENDDSVWKDKYNCVHATVTGGKSVIGGFQFNGEPGSGAEWPVASQGQNQVYIFTEKQFTLAATVIIHTGEEKGEFSLLGASLDSGENNVLIGLGYRDSNKWYAVSNGNQKTTTEETVEREKEYHVALTFVNGVAAVFVDGVDIIKTELKITQTATISHFYMGGMGQSSSAAKGSLCTVKNVILFNRNLEQNEIARLAEVSKGSNLEQTTTELPTVITEDRKSVSTTKSTAVPDIIKLTSRTKETSTPDKSNSVPKTKSTTITDNNKSGPNTETNKASVSSRQTVTNGKAEDKNMNKSQHALLDGALKKDAKNDISAAVSLSAVGWMCLVFLFFALTGL